MVWNASNPAQNILPRWPNTTSYSQYQSAWALDGQDGMKHVIQYNITDGWHTSLVTNIWLHPDNLVINGLPVYQGDYWYMGAKRVDYSALTIEPANNTIPAWDSATPNMSYPWDLYTSPSDSIKPQKVFWWGKSFLQPNVVTTKYRVWGSFTTYVTHLSARDAIVGCYNNPATWSTSDCVAANASTTYALQCPFTFRSCFTPEAHFGTPRCMRNFSADYLDASAVNGYNVPPKEDNRKYTCGLGM